MHKLLMGAVIILLLGACSPLSMLKKFIPTTGDGISVDAQIGSNKNKVGIGAGTVGDPSEVRITTKDSTVQEIKTSTGKYHLSASNNLTVNIYETSKWLLPILVMYILLKPWLIRLLNMFKRQVIDRWKK